MQVSLKGLSLLRVNSLRFGVRENSTYTVSPQQVSTQSSGLKVMLKLWKVLYTCITSTLLDFKINYEGVVTAFTPVSPLRTFPWYLLPAAKWDTTGRSGHSGDEVTHSGPKTLLGSQTIPRSMKVTPDITIIGHQSSFSSPTKDVSISLITENFPVLPN